MAWEVYLNETGLSTIGAVVTRVDNLPAPTREFPTLAVPGRQGVVHVADPVVRERSLTISGTISPSSRTAAGRLTAERNVKSLAYRGLVQIGIDDAVNAPVAIDGVCTSATFVPKDFPVNGTVSDFSLTFLCYNPTWRAITGQVIGFTSTATAVPLGTAPSGGLIRVSAPSWSADVTTPVVSYLNAAGVVLQTMSFATTLSAGVDYLEIDLDRATAVEYASGTASNAIANLTGDFFTLDPMDGDVLNSLYPMLKVTSGAGSPSGQWLGSKRYL